MAPLTPCCVTLDLLMQGHPTSGPSLQESLPTCCCKHKETTKEWLLRRLRLLREQHWWMDDQIILPTPIKKGLASHQTLLACVNENLRVIVTMRLTLVCLFSVDQCSARPAKTNPACTPRCPRCCLWEWPPTCSCHTHSPCSQPTQWPKGEYAPKQGAATVTSQKPRSAFCGRYL